MSREKQLVKNTIIIVFGKICTQCVSFFLLPIYTTLLSTSDFGIVDLLNTYISLLVPIICLKLDNGTFRFLIDSRNEENKKSTILSTAFFSILINSIIFILIMLLLNNVIKFEYFYFLIFNVVISMFSSFLLESSRGLGDNVTYSEGSFIIASGSILFNVIFVVFVRLGAQGMLISFLLANLIGAIFVFFKLKYYAIIKLKSFKLDFLKELYFYSIPLIPNSISWWIINSSNRTIISYFLGVSANGIYSAANKFSGLYITIYSMLNMTFTESVVMHIKDNDSGEFLSNVINTIIKLFSCICIGIIACMPFVFPIMINEKFGEAYYHIPILMTSSLVNVGVGMCTAIYVAKKLSKRIATFSIASAFINIIINIILIKYIGLFSASISSLVAYLVTLILMIRDLRKVIRIKIQIQYIVSILLVLLFTTISYYINNLYLNIATLVIACIFSFVLNKSYLINMLQLIKAKLIKKVF